MKDKTKKVLKVAGISVLVVGSVGGLAYLINKNSSAILKEVISNGVKSASITINSGVKLGKFYMAKEINEALGVFRSMQIPHSKISGILMSEGIEGLLKYAFELRKFRGW
jgi:hypothetical protein